MRPSGDVAAYSEPSGASARACTSSSVLSKNVVTFDPSILNTFPSLPLPTYSEPSGLTTIAHRNGDVVSATTSVAGPRTRRPCPSTDRFSTSPRKKSFRVAVCQKTGFDADRVTAAAAAPAHTKKFRSNERIRCLLDVDCQHARADDGMVGRQIPLAERRVAQRNE